jgi:hypothetical protein
MGDFGGSFGNEIDGFQVSWRGASWRVDCSTVDDVRKASPRVTTSRHFYKDLYRWKSTARCKRQSILVRCMKIVGVDLARREENRYVSTLIVAFLQDGIRRDSISSVSD